MRSRVCLREMHVFTNGERVSYMSVRDVYRCCGGRGRSPVWPPPTCTMYDLFYHKRKWKASSCFRTVSLRATYNIVVGLYRHTKS